MNTVRAWLRMIGLVTSIGGYMIWFYILLPFKRDSLKWGLSLRRSWMKLAHWILGLRVEVKGQLPDKSGLVVCNHQSAIDPFIPMRYLELFPVGKYEIRSYPLIGFAASKTGILFVKREVRDHRRAVREKIREYLSRDRSILVFPEGTVSPDGVVMPFRKGAFGSAADAGRPVFPVAIRYFSTDDRWQDGDSLYRHFVRQVGKQNIKVQLTCCDPVESTDPDECAEKAQSAIESALN